MHFVLFTGRVATDQNALSEQYYKALQPLLHEVEGFIEEVPFIEPAEPGTQLLFARFTDEDAVARWRNHSSHLRIMHRARHNIFEQYRIVVGSDTKSSYPNERNSSAERVVVVYQRPIMQELSPEHMQPEYVAKGVATETLKSFKFYAGENVSLWIAQLKEGADVDHYEALLDRVSGDALYRIHVSREYTKDDRREAPKGIDEAETAAPAASQN